MSKKLLLTQINGWTPLIDELVKKYGVVTAAVYGRVWRYCSGELGVCTASLDTIADGLKMNRMTIIRHIDLLVRDGYLIDKTPNLRNHPHTYVDGYKVKIEQTLAVKQAGSQSLKVTAELPEESLKVTPAITLSDSDSNLKLLEETFKIQIKKQEAKDSDIGGIFRAYENEIGALTAGIGDELQALSGEYAHNWITEAIHISAEQNKRSLAYVKGILKRWKATGKTDTKKQSIGLRNA